VADRGGRGDIDTAALALAVVVAEEAGEAAVGLVAGHRGLQHHDVGAFVGEDSSAQAVAAVAIEEPAVASLGQVAGDHRAVERDRSAVAGGTEQGRFAHGDGPADADAAVPRPGGVEIVRNAAVAAARQVPLQRAAAERRDGPETDTHAPAKARAALHIVAAEP